MARTERMSKKEVVAIRARFEGALAVEAGAPAAIVGDAHYGLGFITKARILYFLMGMAATMFVVADVIAEFDKDPNTHTATTYVKSWRKRSLLGAVTVALSVIWLFLHFMVDGFPL